MAPERTQKKTGEETKKEKMGFYTVCGTAQHSQTR
jgi:hypothetical protein